MAKRIDSTLAKRVINAHEEFLEKLSKAELLRNTLREDIIRTSNRMVIKEAQKVLKEIPIEEINRDKCGFKIKSLKDHGYHTVADISAASIRSISSIHGISEDTAYAIKDAVKNIVSKTNQSSKIILSEDRKTPESSQLILAISIYIECVPYIDKAVELYQDFKDRIRDGIFDLTVATNGFKWLFISSLRKQRAITAFEMLSEMLNGKYQKNAKHCLNALNKAKRKSQSEAWVDFSDHSIRFINTLEDVNPGVLGTNDAMYGLPEELALEIQEQNCFQDGLLCELRRYQEWGVKYILHQERVLLGDEMGLGKTIQAIATMASLRNTGATHFVVVCPASVLSNWCREIRKMSTLSVVKVHGNDKTSALQSWIKTGGVAVTTYETTARFFLDADFKFSLLVVDEAHYIKNPQAQRTRNVRKMSEHAERLLFMTGTALENKVDEMISLIKMLQPKIASSIRGMEFLSSAPQFREKVAPVYYRRKREDVLTELPDLIENKEWCSMTSIEEAAYETAVLYGSFPSARRVSWNVDNLADSSKAKRMMEIIDEAEAEGRKVVVFSFFLDTIRKITMLLGNKCYGPVNGSVPPQKRQEIIDEFDSAPAGSVLAAQIQTGGTGLNIQSASVVIICEPQFKPSAENQAISRAYRMGQTRNVLVHRLLCEDTVDERITQILEDKQTIFDAFADTSVAGSESIELDDKTFDNIINEEIDRINAKKKLQNKKALSQILQPVELC